MESIHEKKKGVRINLTTGYHPKANGQVEQVNQEIGQFLRRFGTEIKEDRAQYLFWIDYAQNVSGQVWESTHQCLEYT